MTGGMNGWIEGGTDRQMVGGREGSTERWMEGRREELEAETQIGGEAFAGGSQGHSQELRSQESCSGEGIVKGQST